MFSHQFLIRKGTRPSFSWHCKAVQLLSVDMLMKSDCHYVWLGCKMGIKFTLLISYLCTQVVFHLS